MTGGDSIRPVLGVVQEMPHEFVSLPATIRLEMPHAGPCAFCGGPDKRHREVDAWVERVHAGDDEQEVADDHGVPVIAVQAAVVAAAGDPEEVRVDRDLVRQVRDFLSMSFDRTDRGDALKLAARLPDLEQESEA